MKKFILPALTIAISLCSCMSHDDANYDGQDNAAIIENAEKIFGTIDANQDWSSINKGSVSIIADADLNDIAKIQILTESPFGNPNAKVLNEAETRKGESVEMVFDAPKACEVLFAACVDSKGNYFVKAFNVGDKEVSFSEPANARMTRGGETFPDLSAIVLSAPQNSFNALRAAASVADPEKPYVVITDQSGRKGSKRAYTDWANGSWANDQLWAVKDATFNGWTIANGEIKTTVSEKVDLTTLKWVVNYYLPKTGAEYTTGTGNKSNNWKSIVEGTNYFKQYKNHFVSNGEPLTIIPLQMNTTEGKYNTIYYYYFPKSKLTEYPTDEALAAYIKTLPKFKAINCKEQKDFKRDTKYLLPYYGDGAVAEGTTPTQLNIPEGYLIGFMNQKANGESTEECMNGCTYGFGPLNIENNHIIGHYFSALSTDIKQISNNISRNIPQQEMFGQTPYGMTWDSPRIGIFSANNKVFMCFEEGCDCNFSDMIIEINSGVVVENDPIEPEAQAYTMCFEDRLNEADYDMNDVVLQGVRLNEDKIQIKLIACGAYDELWIKNLYDSKVLTKKEVHAFFGIKPGIAFINTEKYTPWMEPTTKDKATEIFNIDKSVNLEDFMKQIQIENKTTGKIIEMPKQGEPPYAIIVPFNFNYPVEKCSIINAYPLFKNWAQNRDIDTDWYNTPNNDNVYPNKYAQTEE